MYKRSKEKEQISPKWLIEDYLDGDTIPRLIKSLSTSGIDYKIIERGDYISIRNMPFDKDDCVIFYGSLQVGAHIERNIMWSPGVFCNSDNFRCSKYYSYFGKYLLNNDYYMLPFTEFIRRHKEIFSDKGSIFIRPDSGMKTFTGRPLNRDDVFEFNYEVISLGNRQIEDIIVVFSSVKEIQREWRCVSCNHKIVGVSQYMQDGEIHINEGAPYPVEDLAFEISQSKWIPDGAFTIDIAESNGEFRLVEINSFSCADIYNCDWDPIVRSVNDLAISEYREIYEI